MAVQNWRQKTKVWGGDPCDSWRWNNINNCCKTLYTVEGKKKKQKYIRNKQKTFALFLRGKKEKELNFCLWSHRFHPSLVSSNFSPFEPLSQLACNSLSFSLYIDKLQFHFSLLSLSTVVCSTFH